MQTLRESSRGLTVKEKVQHMEAFKVYYGMGPGRSLRGAGQLIGRNSQTMSRWSRQFSWQARVKVWKDKGIKEVPVKIRLRTTGAPPVSHNPTEKYVLDVMRACRLVLEDCFTYDNEGKITPNFNIRNASEFARVVTAQAKLAELYTTIQRAEKHTSEPNTSKATDNLDRFLGDMTDEQKLIFLTGTGDVEGVPGGVQEADYTEVPDDDSTENGQ